MPYVDQENRNVFERAIEMVAATLAVRRSAGNLNYVITRCVLAHLQHGKTEKPHYKDYNEVIGVLESAKLEVYRRMVAPYEDTKVVENGDVYPKEGSLWQQNLRGR